MASVLQKRLRIGCFSARKGEKYSSTHFYALRDSFVFAIN
jgi:hypothetical protein